MLTTKIIALSDILKTYEKDRKPVFIVTMPKAAVLGGNQAAKKLFAVTEKYALCEQQIPVDSELYAELNEAIEFIKKNNVARQSQYLDLSEFVDPKQKYIMEKNLDVEMMLAHLRCWQLGDGTDLLQITIDEENENPIQQNYQNFDDKKYPDTQEDYKEIFSLMPKPVMIFDAQGRFLFANEASVKKINLQLNENLSITDCIPDIRMGKTLNKMKYIAYMPLLVGGKGRFMASVENIRLKRDDAVIVVLDDVENSFYIRQLLEQEAKMLRDVIELIAEFSWICDQNGKFVRIETQKKQKYQKYEQLFNLTPDQWLKQGIMVGDNPFREVFAKKYDSWCKTCILRLDDSDGYYHAHKKNRLMFFFGKKLCEQHSKENYYVGIAVSESAFEEKKNVKPIKEVGKKNNVVDNIIKVYENQQHQKNGVREILSDIEGAVQNCIDDKGEEQQDKHKNNQQNYCNISWQKLEKLENIIENINLQAFNLQNEKDMSIIITQVKKLQKWLQEIQQKQQKIQQYQNTDLQTNLNKKNHNIAVSKLQKQQKKNKLLNATTVNLSEMLMQCIAKLKNLAAQKHIILRAIIDKEYCVMTSKKSKLRKSLTKVLRHRIEHNPPDSMIIISIKCSDDDVLDIHIRDAGVSSLSASTEDEPAAENEFEVNSEHRSVSPAQSLEMAKKLFQEINGQVQIKNMPPNGAKMSITVPLL